MIAVLPVPGRFEALGCLLECLAGFGGAPARGMKRLRQIRNLGRATALQARIDRPGITPGLADQGRDAYVSKLHRNVQSRAANRFTAWAQVALSYASSATC